MNEWWAKDVSGTENSVAWGQKLEDQNVFQDQQITECGWHIEVKQESPREKIRESTGDR